MEKLLSGEAPQSWQRLLLGAGVLLEGFCPERCPDGRALREALAAAMADDEKRLGRTAGETGFRVEPELAQIRRDTPRWPAEGEETMTRLRVSLTGTLTEVTPANLQRLFPWARFGAAGVVSLRPGGTPRAIRDLCWAGSLSGGGLLVIRLRNAINTAGLILTVGKSGEGLLPFVFTAHSDRTALGPEGVPFDIWLAESEENEA